MRLLLHICCGPCALMPMRALGERSVAFEGLWFNPNIHPKDEYDRRLSALRDLQAQWSLDVRYIDSYGEREFMEAVSGHDGLRCEVCYDLRLSETARIAAKDGFDAFSTSLLVSPYQRHDLIARTGHEMGERFGVRFHYEDWRPLYREGVSLSREMAMYRQRHCGCILSYNERGLKHTNALAEA